ncbi:hypothetical protein ACFLQ8_01055 [Candidatus Auribacterota bacterium]
MCSGCGIFKEVTQNRYVGDKEDKVYHKEHCEKVERIHPFEVITFPYNAAARYEGYKPCTECNPGE